MCESKEKIIYKYMHKLSHKLNIYIYIYMCIHIMVNRDIKYRGYISLISLSLSLSFHFTYLPHLAIE